MTPDKNKTLDILWSWLNPRIDDKGLTWLKQKTEVCAQGNEKIFFTVFSQTTRSIPSDSLALSESEINSARSLCPGWNPADWQLSETARAILQLCLPSDNPEDYARILDQTFESADLSEQISLAKTLVLLPHPGHHLPRARQMTRTNMKPVFEALALHTPYPCEHFDDEAWNQMILKALFIGTSLKNIYGLKQRANPRLKTMLIDYANERQQARRTVSEELWEGVGEWFERQ